MSGLENKQEKTPPSTPPRTVKQLVETIEAQSGVPASQSLLEQFLSVITPKALKTQSRTEAGNAPSSLPTVSETKRSPEEEEKFKKDLERFVSLKNEVHTTEATFIAGLKKLHETLEDTSEYKRLEQNSPARRQVDAYLMPYKTLVNSNNAKQDSADNINDLNALISEMDSLMSWLNARDYTNLTAGTIQYTHFAGCLIEQFGKDFVTPEISSQMISLIQRAPRYRLFIDDLLKNFINKYYPNTQDATKHRSIIEQIKRKIADINTRQAAELKINPSDPVIIKKVIISSLRTVFPDEEKNTLHDHSTFVDLYQFVNTRLQSIDENKRNIDDNKKATLQSCERLLKNYQDSSKVLTALVASLDDAVKNNMQAVVDIFLDKAKDTLRTLYDVAAHSSGINACTSLLDILQFIATYNLDAFSPESQEKITTLKENIERQLKRDGTATPWQFWSLLTRWKNPATPALASESKENQPSLNPSNPIQEQFKNRIKRLAPFLTAPHSFHKIYEGLLEIGPGQKNVERNLSSGLPNEFDTENQALVERNLSSGLPNEFDTENQALLDFVTHYAEKEYCKNPMLAYAAGVAVAGEAKKQKNAPALNEETPPSLFQQLLRQIPKAADTHDQKDQKGEAPNSPDYYAPIRQALDYFTQTEHKRNNDINSVFHSKEVLYSLKNMVLHDINTIFTPPTRTHKTKLDLEEIKQRINDAVPDNFEISNIDDHFNALRYCLDTDIIPLIQTAEPTGNFDKRLFKEYQDRYLPVEQPSKPVQPAVVLPAEHTTRPMLEANMPEAEKTRREQFNNAERREREQNIAEQEKQKTKSMILFLTELTPHYRAFLARKQKDSIEQSKTEAKNQQSANTTTDRLLTLGLFLLMGVALFIYFNPLNFSFSLPMLTLIGICAVICATLVSYLLWMKPNNPWVKAPASIDSAYNMLECSKESLTTIELTSLIQKCNQRLNKQILFSNIDRVKLLLMEDIYPNSLTGYSENNKESETGYSENNKESDLALLCWVSHRNKKNKGCNDLSSEEIEKLRAIFKKFKIATITPPHKTMGRALISGVLMIIFGASLLLSLARLATLLHVSTSLNWLNGLISALNLTSIPLQISSLIFFASTAIAFLCVLWLVRNSDTETKAWIKLFFIPVPALLMFGLGIISASMPMILFAVGVAIPILIYLFNTRTFTRELKRLSKWTLGDAPRLKISLIFFYLFLYSLIPALYSMSMVKTAILWGVACSAALLLAIPYLIEKNLGWARIDTLYETHGKKITIGLGLILLGLIGGLVTTLVLSPLNMAAIIGLSASICVGGLATIASLLCWKTKSPSLMLKAFFNDLALLWVTITPVLVLFELGVLPWNVLLISSVSLFISIGIKLFRKLKNLRDAGYVEKKQAEINEEAEKSIALSIPSFAPANAAPRATSLDLDKKIQPVKQLQQEHVSNIKNSHSALKTKAAFFGVTHDDMENLIDWNYIFFFLTTMLPGVNILKSNTQFNANTSSFFQPNTCWTMTDALFVCIPSLIRIAEIGLNHYKDDNTNHLSKYSTIKEVINLLGAIQLAILTLNNTAGHTQDISFVIIFGISLFFSGVELLHAGLKYFDIGYWKADTQKQIETLNNAIEKSSDTALKKELGEQKARLEEDLNSAKNNNVLPPHALKSSEAEFCIAAYNMLTGLVSFSGMLLTAIISNPYHPTTLAFLGAASLLYLLKPAFHHWAKGETNSMVEVEAKAEEKGGVAKAGVGVGVGVEAEAEVEAETAPLLLATT